MKKCLFCGIEFKPERSTAKFHSDACRVKYARSDTLTKIPDTLITKDWHDTYGLCDGCNGTDCPEGFIPNWTRIKGFDKSKLKERL